MGAGHDVVFLSKSVEWHAESPQGWRLLSYQPHRSENHAALHPYLRRFEKAVLEGQAAYRASQQLLQENWIPDVVITHVGFGNGFYLSDAFPKARRLGLFEWYYNATGSDVDFLNDSTPDPDAALRLRTWNASLLLELACCDVAVVPTLWQQSQFPAGLRARMRVVHEGIDIQSIRIASRNPDDSTLNFPKGPEVEILTYVTRGFDQYRGFPQVMRAIEVLQRKRPNLHALIVGADLIAYGAGREDGRSWGTWARSDLALDPKRTHWLGILQTKEYRAVLARSDVHLYFTVPFVLSWSMLEAMAMGCAIVASDTPPTREILTHQVDALMVDFFDCMGLVDAVERILNDGGLACRLSKAASHASESYDCRLGCDAWMRLLSEDAD
ncbi:glycosyltransferase [Synechococcus sp. MIT S1220]|uniref:glycosyltransferase n=1 Tax=Synechococcus sp. MIT S1220 TaxID=3082549 RepID=UPI0039AEE8F4